METDGDASSRAGVAHGGVAEIQRARILSATVTVVAERGFAGASVGLVCERAGVSRRTYYELFASFEECFCAILDLGRELTGALILQAFQREDSWVGGVRAALAGLLEFFEAEPQIARVLLVECLAAGAWALERRERNVATLREAILAAWSGPELTVSGLPASVAAEGVMASLLGVIQSYMVGDRSTPPIELLGPLTGLTVGPFLPAEQVVVEVRRGRALAAKLQAERGAQRQPPRASGLGVGLFAVEIPALLRNSKAERARRCVRYLAEQGKLGFSPSNRQVAAAVGIAHKEQMSKLLASLEGCGALSKFSHGPGRPNAWRLTLYGEEIAAYFELHEDS